MCTSKSGRAKRAGARSDSARPFIRAWLIASIGFSLAACGGDEEETAAAANDAPTIAGAPVTSVSQGSAPSGNNSPPTISGSPTTSIVVGTPYTFTPTASDPEAQPITFSILRRPAWAVFDAATGRLQGTPPSPGTFADVTISVSDGQVAVPLPSFTILVTPPPVNRAPAISGVPMTSVEAGTAYTFVPTANDPDGDPLIFAITGRPSWAAFDTRTGRLSGTPPSGTSATFNTIRISVSDGPNTASLPAFTITVTAPTANRPPTISGAPATTATQGTLYTFTPTASDLDGDSLTFEIANRPTWATFNATTGRLQGTPGAAHIRTYSNIVISVRDAVASTPLPTFAITVASSNNPPTISGTPPTTATAGTQYSFTPAASDPDGGTLTFSVANAPSWAVFTQATGRLQGTPTAAGTFTDIRISVSDGQDSAQLAPFSIIVDAAPNRPPTISGVPTTAVVAGTPYAFTPTASDPDTDTLTFRINVTPSWASFDAATGRLSGTPAPQHVGTTTGIVITADDGEATASLAAFNVTVQAMGTGSATVSWIPPTTNTDGSPLTNLAGYKVYWGPSQGNYPSSATLNNPGSTSYVVGNLVPGTYFFVATALNEAGVESSFSPAASKTIL